MTNVRRSAFGFGIRHLAFDIDLDAKSFGIPPQTELAGRRHVADERRGGDDGGAGEVAFAAESHPVLPVAVERGDGALARSQRVGALAETGTTPRLADLAAGRAEDFCDRLTAEPRIRLLDLAADAARPRKN